MKNFSITGNSGCDNIVIQVISEKVFLKKTRLMN